jgi:hypothetical protein
MDLYLFTTEAAMQFFEHFKDHRSTLANPAGTIHMELGGIHTKPYIKVGKANF